MASKKRELSPLTTKKWPRLFFIDNLRAVLILLVVMHHLVLKFLLTGTEGLAVVKILGSLFTTFNQAFFMGLFFLISAYFIPSAYNRKGSVRFIRDRFTRLIIPLIFYFFALSQVEALEKYILGHEPFTWRSYLANLSTGPMWFVELLFIFICLYVVRIRIMQKDKPIGDSRNTPPSKRIFIGFTLALTAVTFIWRLWVPMLGGPSGSPKVMEIVGIFTPSGYDLPQYIGFFIVGIIAFQRNWFQNTTNSMGKTGLVVTVTATILLFPLAMVLGIEGIKFTGGWTLSSLVYTLWESIFSVGISTWLITFFRERFNNTSKSWTFLSDNAFTVYMIHIPIISLVSILISSIQVSSAFRFSIAVLMTFPICFVLSYFIRKLPLASKIL